MIVVEIEFVLFTENKTTNIPSFPGHS